MSKEQHISRRTKVSLFRVKKYLNGERQYLSANEMARIESELRKYELPEPRPSVFDTDSAEEVHD